MTRRCDASATDLNIFQPFVSGRPDAASAGAGAGTSWFGNVVHPGSDIPSCVIERLNADMQTQHDLFRCSSLAELQRVQATFVQKVLDQCHANTARLAGMSRAMVPQKRLRTKAET